MDITRYMLNKKYGKDLVTFCIKLTKKQDYDNDTMVDMTTHFAKCRDISIKGVNVFDLILDVDTFING